MMEEICMQCGDKGFTNAFIHCVRCLKFVVHRYCLDVIPESRDEFVRWFCDDCEEARKKRAALGHGADPPQRIDWGMKKITIGAKKIDAVVAEERVDKSGVVEVYNDLDERERCRQSPSQQVEEEKAKDEPVQYAKSSDDDIASMDIMKGKRKHAKLRDIFLKENINEKHVVSNKLSKQSHEECTESDSIKSNKGTKRKFQRRISLKLCDSDIGYGMAEYPTVSCNGSLKGSKKNQMASTGAVVQEWMHKIGSAQPLRENEVLNSVSMNMEDWNVGKNHNLIENKESKDRGEKTHHGINSCKVCETNSIISPAEPVVLPIWRGSFSIRSKKHDVLEGLVAHMSLRACQQVYDTASQFGPVVCLEKLPRSEVWPKSFETSGTSGDSIALFFFSTKMSECEFDHLFNEMMHEDLALKASVQNAELLIFTSTELPLRYWIFQRKNYLWGVFSGKQSST